MHNSQLTSNIVLFVLNRACVLYLVLLFIAYLFLIYYYYFRIMSRYSTVIGRCLQVREITSSADESDGPTPQYFD